MRQISRPLIASIMLGTAVLAGCATGSNSGSVYSRGQAQREQVVRMATVETVREVTLDGGQSGVGVLAGGALGGIAAGRNIGSGTGSLVAGIIGAVAGGLAGQAVEGHVSKQRALEITVRLDNGELRAITQEADEIFRPGERVRLLSSGGVTRVTR